MILGGAKPLEFTTVSISPSTRKTGASSQSKKAQIVKEHALPQLRDVSTFGTRPAA
jgi:hypothetical protein